ncbi:MAG TPA: hypothetical protein VHO06_07225 [Polyangia bacterium]|nr:hypothetical protein [Polyangia bacterium]
MNPTTRSIVLGVVPRALFGAVTALGNLALRLVDFARKSRRNVSGTAPLTRS